MGRMLSGAGAPHQPSRRVTLGSCCLLSVSVPALLDETLSRGTRQRPGNSLLGSQRHIRVNAEDEEGNVSWDVQNLELTSEKLLFSSQSKGLRAGRGNELERGLHEICK